MSDKIGLYYKTSNKTIRMKVLAALPKPLTDKFIYASL